MPSHSVLVVEDDDVIRALLKELLEYHGYEVTVAAHGRDALAYLAQTPEVPRLLVMDLMMPVMNGWELLKELRKDPRWKRLPVVVLSAGGRAEGLSDDPAVRFMSKPPRMNVMLELLKELTT